MIAAFDPCPFCGKGKLLVDHEHPFVAHSVPYHKKCATFLSVKTATELGEAVDRYRSDVRKGATPGRRVRMTVEEQLDGPALSLRRSSALFYREL